jgi:glycerol-3-phosphate acyltransferase PlsY
VKILYIVLIYIAIFFVSYLLGSIPNGVIIGRLFYGKDPRTMGSHNPGGTNTGRTIGRSAGVITMALDILKAIVATLSTFLIFKYARGDDDLFGYDVALNAFGRGNTLIQLATAIAAISVMLGHAYSVFLKFKGGKIVSTFVGVSLFYSWLIIPLFAPLFFLLLKKTKHVSSSSISSAIAISLFTWVVYFVYLFSYSNGDYSSYLMWFLFGESCSIYYPILTTLAAALLICRHKDNIERLKEHKESQIKWMK